MLGLMIAPNKNLRTLKKPVVGSIFKMCVYSCNMRSLGQLEKSLIVDKLVGMLEKAYIVALGTDKAAPFAISVESSSTMMVFEGAIPKISMRIL
jgi:hypothetical protein